MIILKRYQKKRKRFFIFVYIKKIKKKKVFEIGKTRANNRLKYRYFINHRKYLIQYYFFRNVVNYFLSNFYQKKINKNLFNSIDIIKKYYLYNFKKCIYSIKLFKWNRMINKTKKNARYKIKLCIFIKFNLYII